MSAARRNILLAANNDMYYDRRLLKYKIRQMTFYLNMIYQDEQDNEEKATLDDDINTFSAALISCHISLTCSVYIQYQNT